MAKGSRLADDVNVDLEHVYNILGNVHKRRIILFLGEHGKASFSELRRALKVSVGNLYYNLDGLAGYVSKSSDRKYYLTDRGIALYKFLLDQESMLKSYLVEKGSFRRFLDKYVLPVIVPRDLMSVLYKQKTLSLAAIIASLLIGVVSVVQTKSCYVMLEIFDGFSYSLAARMLFFLASLVGVLFIIEVVSRLLGASFNVQLDFLGAIMFSLTPIYISTVITHAVINDVFIQGLVFRLFQVITLGLLTATISVYKKIPLEKSFIAVFVLYYTSYTLSILLTRL